MSIIEYTHIGGGNINMIEIFKALGDETRIRILNILMRKELCVCEIETILNITQSNASRHLNKLKSAGIITSTKEAQWVHYQVSNDFNNESNLLYKYLENKLENNSVCSKDLERLQRYATSCFTCEHIREDKNLVMQFLETE